MRVDIKMQTDNCRGIRNYQQPTAQNQTASLKLSKFNQLNNQIINLKEYEVRWTKLGSCLMSPGAQADLAASGHEIVPNRANRRRLAWHWLNLLQVLLVISPA